MKAAAAAMRGALPHVARIGAGALVEFPNFPGPGRVKTDSDPADTQLLIGYTADLATMIRKAVHDYPDIS